MYNEPGIIIEVHISWDRQKISPVRPEIEDFYAVSAEFLP